jgi:predicted nucleotidyltransferase
MFYESELLDYLEESFPGSTIVLFGSFAFGEDNNDSDIDIAIIGSKQKEINLEKYNKLLSKEIILQFYPDFSSIHKNLRESILNGIILKGAVRL